MSGSATSSYQSLSDFLAGLRVLPNDPRKAARDALLAIFTITATIVVADGVVFHAYIPAWYVRIYAGPDLAERIFVYMVRCVSEEVTYRLVLMTALITVAARLWGSAGRSPIWAVWMAILIVQAVNIIPKTPPPQTWQEVPWMFLRFYVPGIVWGWLYWRRGFITPLLAHPSIHLILQPLLLRVLTR